MMFAFSKKPICSPLKDMGMRLYGSFQGFVLELPNKRDLPDPGIEPGSPTLQTDSSPTDLLGKPFVFLRVW